jgi:hypothetical protein
LANGEKAIAIKHKSPWGFKGEGEFVEKTTKKPIVEELA